MSDLRRELIRLAHQNPEMRPHLLPLLAPSAGGNKTAALIRPTDTFGEVYSEFFRQACTIAWAPQGLEAVVEEDAEGLSLTIFLVNRVNHERPFMVGLAGMPTGCSVTLYALPTTMNGVEQPEELGSTTLLWGLLSAMPPVKLAQVLRTRLNV